MLVLVLVVVLVVVVVEGVRTLGVTPLRAVTRCKGCPSKCCPVLLNKGLGGLGRGGGSSGRGLPCSSVSCSTGSTGPSLGVTG